MRVVVLAPSIWSEVSVAVASRLAHAGHAPVGAISLPSLHPATILRKAMQWGPGDFARYAVRRVTSRGEASAMRNAYLAAPDDPSTAPIANLTDAGRRFGFPVHLTKDVNGDDALARVREWNADALIYSGGGILRSRLLRATPVGVLNMHIGLLPEVRGMSCPEWSLLTGIPLGVTIHLIEEGIDTGPVILRRELPLAEAPDTIRAVRDRLTAMGVEMVVEAVDALVTGRLAPVRQTRLDEDLQHFVIHGALTAVAQRRLEGAHREMSAAGAGHECCTSTVHT